MSFRGWWMNELWNIRATQYYSAIKKEERTDTATCEWTSNTLS